MSKYSPTAARDLLEKEKDGITLEEYLVSAMGEALLEFTGDDDLAVVALADDLVPGVLEDLAGLDLNKYEIEPEADIEEDEPTAGDIYERAHGLTIITPHGEWDLHDEEVLKLITGLSTMLHHRLTNPWSHTNPSTILTRGRITAHLHEGVF